MESVDAFALRVDTKARPGRNNDHAVLRHGTPLLQRLKPVRSMNSRRTDGLRTLEQFECYPSVCSA